MKLQNENPKMFRYLSIVIIFSVLINIPRFLETELEWKTFNSSSDDSVDTKLTFRVSTLRKDADYIR